MFILHLTVGVIIFHLSAAQFGAAEFGAFQHKDAKGKCKKASVFGNAVSKGASITHSGFCL